MISAEVRGPGAFYGRGRHEILTSSFEFAEMNSAIREIPEHTHLSAHFVLVVRGVYLTAALPYEGPCGPSTLVYNPSGTTHRDRFRSIGGKFFTVSIRPDIAAQIEKKIYSPVAFMTGEITRTILGAYSEFHDQTEFSPLILEGLGLELAGKTGQRFCNLDHQIPRWLKIARDFIQDSRYSCLRVKDISDEVGVHPIHLARAFRKFFHSSPGEYARKCRMERVREFLATSKAPLAEIALQVGFKDQSQFTHAFKQFTGMTPGRFRRAFRS